MESYSLISMGFLDLLALRNECVDECVVAAAAACAPEVVPDSGAPKLQGGKRKYFVTYVDGIRRRHTRPDGPMSPSEVAKTASLAALKKTRMSHDAASIATIGCTLEQCQQESKVRHTSKMKKTMQKVMKGYRRNRLRTKDLIQRLRRTVFSLREKQSRHLSAELCVRIGEQEDLPLCFVSRSGFGYMSSVRSPPPTPSPPAPHRVARAQVSWKASVFWWLSSCCTCPS